MPQVSEACLTKSAILLTLSNPIHFAIPDDHFFQDVEQVSFLCLGDSVTNQFDVTLHHAQIFTVLLSTFNVVCFASAATVTLSAANQADYVTGFF